MAWTLSLLLDPFTEESVAVEVNGARNQRWRDMLGKSIEALGKAKHNFWNDFDHYEISLYGDYFKVTIYLENEDELHIEYPWYELFPVEMIREFSEKGYTIPDDITREQELETEKVLIRKIWSFYKI